MSFSLYAHIPYCQSKCPYCDFNSYTASNWPEEDYTQALCAELARRAGEEPWAGQSVGTIFFGGGTPSLFRPESIARVIETADRLFKVEREAEITLEANPGTVGASKFEGMRAAGVNRISLGAQSFKPETLKFLGRIHNAEETRLAVHLAHRAGFERLNLDLIFAVPGQTLDDIQSDVDAAVALGPDHISGYNLAFEEATPFFAEMKRGRIRPLDNDEQALMYSTIREELPRRGYAMYEISNYAIPGHESRHNLTYWRAESYLGIGAGAHSFARKGPDSRNGNLTGAAGRRWWNERNPARYISLALGTGTAESGAEVIDWQTAAGEFLFLNLRLREGFALADFERRFGKSFDEVFGARAGYLFEGGLLLRDAGRIRLSDRGLEMADSIFAELL